MTIILTIIGIISSLLIVVFVLVMIRKRKLTDEYATLWLVSSFLILLGAIFSKGIFLVYQLIKGTTGAGLGILLFLLLIFVIFLLIIITSHISVHQEQIKNLTQKIGLLDNKLRKSDNHYSDC